MGYRCEHVRYSIQATIEALKKAKASEEEVARWAKKYKEAPKPHAARAMKTATELNNQMIQQKEKADRIEKGLEDNIGKQKCGQGSTSHQEVGGDRLAGR